MEVSANNQITLVIDGTEFKLTATEAERLYNQLGACLGKAGAFSYPAGVRSPYVPLMPAYPSPGIPSTTPNYPPGTITCSTVTRTESGLL